WARDRAAHTVVLPRLGLEDVTALVARRLRAVPDAGLAGRVHRLTRGIPAAVDALLVEWSGRDAIRVADGHAFLGAGTPVPVLPDGDRYVLALRSLGEPCWTVAAALSVLWPLGRTAAALVAASTGLSAAAVGDSIRRLVDEGILDELSGQDATSPRGWTFRVPLMADAVRERLGPLERGRLSAAAVGALWADGGTPATGTPYGTPAAAILGEADAETYLPDRIAEAGILVDPERAVAELTAAARALYPDLDRRGALRWYLGAVRLIEDPLARDLTVLRCGQAAHGCGDYPTAREAAESIMSNPAEGMDPVFLHEAATLLVASAGAEKDWPALSRMGTASWWDGLPLPAVAALAGRVQALWQLEKWREALTLLSQTEPVWQAAPGNRAVLELFSEVGEFVLGRPHRFTRALTTPDLPDLSRSKMFAIVIAQLDMLLGTGDLRRATALLAARGQAPELLPACSQFLLKHLEGRWDEALALARRLLVDGGVLNVVPGHHLVPARTAAVLLARGRTTSAGRLISSARGQADGHLEADGPLEHVLDHIDAEVRRTVGDLGRAEEILRRGLSTADARGSVYGTDELWASLAEVLMEAGHTGRAVACLEPLERLAKGMDSGRTRLLYLLTYVRVLRPGPADARRHLLEAVELARERGQMFETAVTLTAAARADAGSATLLHEAYELFGETGATLWRFHARAAMRETGLVVPGRKQATAENEQLLATLLAEGLTNRRIAAVLRLSEDAVANRLSRLFARTGIRSRTEVVTAVLAGGPLTANDQE
ncbi:LuxR C-terminal-related transcriptional regulator, partial [Streptomyces lushanensis]|uniref:LuxR C-terminal-related transcriptional regulator n=1 Tax=Streptomyces lushanensis TaxID=1434255 RepID=UPI000A801B15